MTMKWFLWLVAAAFVPICTYVCTSTPAVFLETPSSLNVTVGTVAKFNCSSEGATSLYWLVNGSTLQDPKNQDKMITAKTFSPGANVLTSTLSVPILTATTDTTVQCVAVTVNSEHVVIHNSCLAVIMAQGSPEKVSRMNLSVDMDRSLHLSWTPPPTIDLTDVDPNLHYSVTIVKQSYTPSGVIESTVNCEECPLSVPEYSFQGETSSCVLYNLSVYAFNAAGRGESVSKMYSIISAVPQFISLDGFVTNTSSVMATFKNKELNMEIKLPGLESDQIAGICYFTLDTTDVTFYGFPIIGGMNLTINHTVLPFHHNYTVNITACNVNGCNYYGSSITLSTHDIQQVFLNNEQGLINISIVFANGSLAKGSLIVLGNENGSAQRFIAVLDDMEDQTIFTRLKNVTNGEHRVMLFDIEGDSGLPSENAAIDTTIEVTDGMDEVLQTPPSTTLSANITAQGQNICISCNFLSANGCLVLVHSQENPLQLTRHTIVRQEMETSAVSCFLVDEGNYSVAVFSINHSTDGITITERYPTAVEYAIQITAKYITDPPDRVREFKHIIVAVAVSVSVTLLVAATVTVSVSVPVLMMYRKKKTSFEVCRHSVPVVFEPEVPLLKVNVIEGNTIRTPYQPVTTTEPETATSEISNCDSIGNLTGISTQGHPTLPEEWLNGQSSLHYGQSTTYSDLGKTSGRETFEMGAIATEGSLQDATNVSPPKDTIVEHGEIQQCSGEGFIVIAGHNLPQLNTEPNHTLQDSTPQDSTPQDSTPQDNSPQDNGPQDSTPQDSTPQGNGPQDNALEYNALQDSAHQDSSSESQMYPAVDHYHFDCEYANPSQPELCGLQPSTQQDYNGESM